MSKILLIQTAFPGDVILVTPLFRAIRQELPGSQVTAMVIPETKNILEHNPFVKKLWNYDKHSRGNSVSYLKKWVRKIKDEKFDIALLPHRSYRTALLARLAGIPIRIGFDRSPAKWLYSHVVKYNYEGHEVSRNLSLLKPFGVINLGVIRQELFPDEQDETMVKGLMAANDLTGKEKIIALAPGSIWFTKRWPEMNFTGLTDLFLNRGYRICLIGGSKDIALGDFIIADAGSRAVNFIGKLTLRQTAYFLSKCRLLVCNDSAPTHLGSAVNIPTITIFGSTVPEFGFSPIAEKQAVMQKEMACRPCTDHGRKKCPRKTLACLRDISPEEVFNSALALLK